MLTQDVPIFGNATISQKQALRFLTTRPLEDTELSAIIQAYYTIAHKEYGLNVPVVVAQAIHETGRFTSDWAQDHRNYCGLGVTDGQWRHGWAFPTIELGVHAHCAHLLAYTNTPHNAICQQADPRHFAHNGKIATIGDFNGSGWSANSSSYGTAIMAIYDAMRKGI